MVHYWQVFVMGNFTYQVIHKMIICLKTVQKLLGTLELHVEPSKRKRQITQKVCRDHTTPFRPEAC